MNLRDILLLFVFVFSPFLGTAQDTALHLGTSADSSSHVALEVNGDQLKHLEELEAQVKAQRAQIAENDSLLQLQAQQLDAQQVDLNQKDEQLDVQRQLLFVSLALLFVIFILVYNVYIGYRHKKRTSSIIEQQAKLVEAGARQKEEFLANMSHEIRTPMNAVMGFTNLLLKSPLQGKQREHLESIKISSKNLLNIINDILDLSKIEAGKIEIEELHFDLLKILHNILDSFQVAASEKRIQLHLEYDGGPLLVVGDPTRISQVLLNLVGNGIKFTERGHVILSVHVERKSAEELLVSYRVTDTGIGIRPQVLVKIFDKFTQSDQSITRRYGGTGLGLPISKKLVELMGGDLQATSESGLGSQFFFTLPHAVGRVAELQGDAHQEIQIQGIEHIRILFADDHALNQKMMKQQFAEWNEEISLTAVCDGQEVLKALDQEKYDVILMDVHMPNMDGIQTTRYIRETLKMDIPIIGLSANTLKEDTELCFQAGMNDYIIKPFELNDLLTAIAKLLDLKVEVNVASGSSQQTDADQEFLDLGRIYRMCKDLSEVRTLIHELLGEVPSEIDSLCGALSQYELGVVATNAHGLSNKALYVGSKEFLLTCQALEKAAKRGDVEQCKALVDQLKQVWQSTEEGLRGHVDGLIQQ